MNIEVTIDFSNLSLSKERDILQYLSKDDRKKLVRKDGSLDNELMKVIDFASLPSDIYKELVGRAYDEFCDTDKATFIADRLKDANESSIEDYYNDYIRQNDDSDDNGNDEAVEEEDSFDPDTAEDPARCWMMKQILRAFNRSRIEPTREEAMETVKQMYDLMGWK